MNAPFQQLPFHDLANIFPLVDGAEFDALCTDIETHGVREPVVLYEGAILDGRNRYRASQVAGVDCPMEEYTGDDAAAFVVSLNIHRRHLTESQRAMAAAKLANMKRGHRTDIEPSANLPEVPAVSQSDAARLLNVSDRSLRTAKHVQEFAPEDISRAVDEGRISVSLASKVASLPDEAKADIVSAPPEQTRDVAREAVKKAHVAHNSGNNEWYTPETFVKAARDVMGGIDLDPASSEIANETVQAAQYFTAEDDGLAQDWPQARIWMNPPYAQPLMGQFASKFADAVRDGSEGIVLVNNATETGWFQEIARECSAICFPKTRIRFLDTEGNASGAPLQGQAIIYCGPNPAIFEAEFAKFGLVVRHG